MSTTRKKIINYIGSFPPPYGGVTIKNELLLKHLKNDFDVKRFKGKNRFLMALWITKCVFSKSPLIIGVSSKKKKSLFITRILYIFNKKLMSRSLYFMMGGTESSRISNNKKELKMYSFYKRIFVEMDEMKQMMISAGLSNVSIYPNCRERAEFEKKEHNGFKALFFSQISYMKGADILLEVAKTNKKIQFVFYGEIDESFKNEFFTALEELQNVTYMGVYKGSGSALYDLLSSYDVLIFPTRWKSEGIPGVLVEAKLSGLPAIVSDVSFNSKLINDMVDGIVLKKNDYVHLESALIQLVNNRFFLSTLGKNAKLSSDKYVVSNYINKIVDLLNS